MTRSEAIEKLKWAFCNAIPSTDPECAQILAEEAVCALGGDLKLDPEIASMDAKVTRTPTHSMM
jgi:hypothetical protein